MRSTFTHIFKVANKPLVRIGEHIAHHVHQLLKPLTHNLYDIFLITVNVLQRMRTLQYFIRFNVNIVNSLLIGVVIEFLEKAS